MVVFTGEVLAGPRERFSQHAFDGQIGKQVLARFGAGFAETGTLLAAEVAEDGRAVRLTVEVEAP